MPLTVEQREKSLENPAMCELLPIRDYLDNIMVRTDGSFVAGYELKGLTSYFASDEGRDRGKVMLEALLRSLPEQSMRVQFRYELAEDLGDLLERYVAGQRSDAARVVDLDVLRLERWRSRRRAGYYYLDLSSSAIATHGSFHEEALVSRRG